MTCSRSSRRTQTPSVASPIEISMHVIICSASVHNPGMMSKVETT